MIGVTITNADKTIVNEMYLVLIQRRFLRISTSLNIAYGSIPNVIATGTKTLVWKNTPSAKACKPYPNPVNTPNNAATPPNIIAADPNKDPQKSQSDSLIKNKIIVPTPAIAGNTDDHIGPTIGSISINEPKYNTQQIAVGINVNNNSALTFKPKTVSPNPVL